MCRVCSGYYDFDLKGLPNIYEYANPEHQDKFGEYIDIFLTYLETDIFYTLLDWHEPGDHTYPPNYLGSPDKICKVYEVNGLESSRGTGNMLAFLDHLPHLSDANRRKFIAGVAKHTYLFTMFEWKDVSLLCRLSSTYNSYNFSGIFLGFQEAEISPWDLPNQRHIYHCSDLELILDTNPDLVNFKMDTFQDINIITTDEVLIHPIFEDIYFGEDIITIHPDDYWKYVKIFISRGFRFWKRDKNGNSFLSLYLVWLQALSKLWDYEEWEYPYYFTDLELENINNWLFVLCLENKLGIKNNQMYSFNIMDNILSFI